MTEDKKKLPSWTSTLNTIAKKHGQLALVDLSKKNGIPQIESIRTGIPTLDFVIGRGLPLGKLIEIFGPEASGKTTLSLYMLKYYQQTTGKKIVYIDLENGFDAEYAKKLGIDLNTLLVSQPDSGEAALDIVEKLCQSNEVAAIVVDSVSHLIPSSVTAKDIDGTANIGTTARLMSQTMPRISQAADRSKTSVIFINQIRMKIGVLWGNPETTGGGLALKFAASLRLEVKSIKTDDDLKSEGINVKIKAMKNKLAPPFKQCELFLRFGEGFDEVKETFNLALNLGIIEKAGGWYSYGALKEQGWETFIEKAKQTDGCFEKILKTIQELDSIN